MFKICAVMCLKFSLTEHVYVQVVSVDFEQLRFLLTSFSSNGKSSQMFIFRFICTFYM